MMMKNDERGTMVKTIIIINKPTNYIFIILKQLQSNPDNGDDYNVLDGKIIIVLSSLLSHCYYNTKEPKLKKLFALFAWQTKLAAAKCTRKSIWSLNLSTFPSIPKIFKTQYTQHCAINRQSTDLRAKYKRFLP